MYNNNLPNGVTQADIDRHHNPDPVICWDFEIVSREIQAETKELEIELHYFANDKESKAFLEDRQETVRGFLSLPEFVCVPLEEFKDSSDEDILYYIETKLL